MVSIDPDAPWWANLAVILIVLIVPTIVAHYAQKKNLDKKLADTQSELRDQIGKTRKSIDIVQNEVKNTHTSNLRHDIDALSLALGEIKTMVMSNSASIDRVEGHCADLDETQKAMKRSFERNLRQQAEDLSEAVAQRERDVQSLRKAVDSAVSAIETLKRAVRDGRKQQNR